MHKNSEENRFALKKKEYALGASNTIDNSGLSSLPHSLDFKDAKKAFALKIAGSIPTGGSSPAKIIHAFIQVKDYEGLDRYLTKYAVPKDVLDFALQKACIASNAEAVDVLANHGANVDFVDQFGTTALHFAMRGGGDPQVLLSLLMHGIAFDDWRSDGQSLLHWACQWGHINIVRYLVEDREANLHEYDDLGRFPIHIAATFGRPDVLCYLVDAYSENLLSKYVPSLFLDALNDLDEFTESVESKKTTTLITPSILAKRAAAANYLDKTRRTPLHCASSEEAVNDYSQCISILLQFGGDPMLVTSQGKTALDLAYEAGRAKILIDIMPTEMMVELLMRINDVVPISVRQKTTIDTEEEKETYDVEKGGKSSPNASLQRISGIYWKERSLPPIHDRRLHSVIRRLTDQKEQKGGQQNVKDVTAVAAVESVNLMLVWRKILLNDDVDLLEALRDSLCWCQSSPEYLKKKREFREKASNSQPQKRYSPADFETSQGLKPSQLSELFFDCYENGTGVFSHIQSNFSTNLKAHDFLTVLRSLTGLVIFEKLSLDGVVLLSPLHNSILFLAVICGRFRIAEQLLRMRQFDLIPASVLVVLIFHRLFQEPTFPEQVRCELQQFATRVEAIAVDVLTMVSLKDNTPEKEICRNMLNVPLRICGDLSLIDLFAKAKCTDLLSLPISQRVLDERWRGVLTHLPNWVGWVSRFCPFIGLFHLERRARRERAKALIEFIAEAATYTTTPDATLEKNVFSPLSREVHNWSSNPGKQNEEAKNIVNFATSAMKRRCAGFNMSDKNNRYHKTRTRFPVTIYDKMSTQYSWKKSPRSSFVRSIYTSPEVKFFFHSMCHIIFLILFTVVLVNSLHFRIHITEWCAIAYTIGYAVEEIRQMFVESLRGQFKNYLHDSWNMLELSAVGFTLFGFSIRISKMDDIADYDDEAYDRIFYIARVLYLFGLHLFCMRTLFITSISPVIGPRLKMMADMLRKDLIPLLIVFAIFVLSYGVSFQGLMYPNSFYLIKLDNDTQVYKQYTFVKTVEKLISRAFYSIFEVSVALEEAECEDSASCGNPIGNKLVILFVLIVYTGIVNLILINLLIALFSNTVSRIGMQSTAHWLADRYQMVKEYQDKSVFPPPFNILSIFCEINICLLRKFKCCRLHSISDRRSTDIYLEVEDQSCEKCKDESETYDTVSNRKWNKKIRNSRRLQKLTHQRRSSQFSGSTESEIVLQFVLVQSFALKDRRYSLGIPSASVGVATTVSATTSSMEHKIQALEQKIETWLPLIYQEIQILNSRLLPADVELGHSSQSLVIPKIHTKPCKSKLPSPTTKETYSQSFLIPNISESSTEPITSVRTHSFLNLFNINDTTTPQDGLNKKRPVSFL